MPVNKTLLFRKRAFTLLELSISLIIISIMVTGIVVGSGLITASKLSLARSLTANSSVPKIEGLVAWYETSSFDSFEEEEASDGSTISAWYDINPYSLSERKNTLVAKVGAVSYVKEGINDTPSLQFGDYNNVSNLDLTSFHQGTSSQNTVFAVISPRDKAADGDRDYIFIDSYDGQARTSFGINDNAPGRLILNTGTVSDNARTKTVNNAPTFTLDKPYIIALYIDGAFSRGYVNETTITAGDDYFDINPGNNVMNGLTIGSRETDQTNGRFVGLISEIIIYNRPLQNKERESVFTYLSRKYDIPLKGA